MCKDIWNVDCESTISRLQVQLWYNRFKEGREDVNYDVRPDLPSTAASDVNIEAVKKMILDNLRITCKDIADDVSISFGSWQAIFKDVLCMKRAEMKCFKIAKFWAKITSHDIFLKQVIPQLNLCSAYSRVAKDQHSAFQIFLHI